MTCDPDLIDEPSTFEDPENGGLMLYWSCCNRTWLISATDLKPARTNKAWHFAAEALASR
jgi:hypothetical protein